MIYSQYTNFIYISYTTLDINDKLKWFITNKSRFQTERDFYYLLYNEPKISLLEQIDSIDTKELQERVEFHKKIEYSIYNNNNIDIKKPDSPPESPRYKVPKLDLFKVFK